MSAVPVVSARPRILIAEDQPDVVEALRIALKTEGFDTLAAHSPDAAVEAIQSQRFDLLLMDLNYSRDTTSGVEGLELLSRVQHLDPELPVIVMTAWGTVDVAVEAMQRGASDFIQKPWDNWRLIGMVRNQMDRRNRLRKAESDREREMREAGELQKRLLPQHITNISGLDIAVDWKPARTLGGDYFDVLRFSDGSVGLCIADVEGKGVPAALVMSNLQSAVKAFSGPEVEPRQLCQRLNSIFCTEVQTDRSISLFYARIDASARRITYVNAGHLPPLLIRRSGALEQLDSGGAILGRLPQWTYDECETALESGDVLVLFTDGVTEAENHGAEEFGTERIAACTRMYRESTASGLQERLLAAAAEHCGNRFEDDATLMVARVK